MYSVVLAHILKSSGLTRRWEVAAAIATRVSADDTSSTPTGTSTTGEMNSKKGATSTTKGTE